VQVRVVGEVFAGTERIVRSGKAMGIET
jgi:hypothetical protein